MKMVEIPSLYELACRAYSDTDIPGYQEAFEQAMTQGEKPSLILMRINSLVELIPYQDGMIHNPFAWRVVYVNEELFGLHGPLQNRNGEVSQVAVIEDRWCDYFGEPIFPPKLDATRYNNHYGWNRDPFESQDLTPEEVNVRLKRCLYPVTIIKDMQEIISRYDPDEHGLPIEGHWFEDAELPLRVVDGVPESLHHSRRRYRHYTPGVFHRHDDQEREYQQDPDWYLGLNEEYEKMEAEQMEE